MGVLLGGTAIKTEPLARVIDSMLRTVPVIRRKLHREVLKSILQQFGQGISPLHLMILKVLEESGDMLSSEIGDELSIARPQMTYSIDKLISLGMVERQPDTRDRRKIYIRLTPEGRDAVGQLDGMMANRVRTRLSALTDDELKKLAASFDNIRETFLKLP